MSGLSLLLQSALCCVLVLLAVLSLQLACLTLMRIFRPKKPLDWREIPEDSLPRVLVQLPVCNEGDLAVRVAAAAARLNWPKDRLEIQLLDDGSAIRHEELARAVRRV